MTNLTPSRDEIAMAVMRRLRNVDRLTADFALALAENITDDLLALLAAKRVATAHDVPAAFAPLTFGPIGPVEVAPRAFGGVPGWQALPDPPVPGWQVLPDPPVPHPQTAEPDAWMATTTGSQPKEGDEHE